MLSIRLAKRLGEFALEAEFEMHGAGIVALFGRSGSGKTTVVNLIAGLTRADRGRVSLDGSLLLDTDAGVDLPAEKRRIGYVFQDARLFPHLNVSGNLRYGLQRAAAGGIGFDAVVDLLALGPLLERRTHHLSGGEKQRVAIGRALLSQPRLLLLDEPLASLDASRREDVLPYLETLRDAFSLPMVFVSHDFEDVRRLATHLVLFEHGRVTAQGPVAQMSLDAGVRSLVGPDSIGAVLEAEVIGPAAEHLLRIRVGDAELLVESAPFIQGRLIRVQIMARDIIVATEEPRALSVRNVLPGVIHDVTHDDPGSDLVFIEAGGAILVARVSKLASRELHLRPKLKVWALVKSVALRGQASPSA